MGRGRIPAVTIELSSEERRELDGLTRRRRTAQGLSRRAQIVLLAAEGWQNKTIAGELGVTANTVGKWRRRFAEHRLEGLCDEPRPGAPRQIGDDAIAETVRLTLEETPPDATHWSLRSMARATGYAPSTVHRIWQAFGLQPHRSETFKLSSDPLFVDKVRDIVGLYLDPPERALVLCVDEKSQIQALDRTQPLLPMRPGQAERRSHDYKRCAGHCPCSPLWIPLPGASSGDALPATVPVNSVLSSTPSRHRCRANSTSTSSWTILPPIKPVQPATGLPAIRVGMSTTRQPRHPGSTRSSVSLAC